MLHDEVRVCRVPSYPRIASEQVRVRVDESRTKDRIAVDVLVIRSRSRRDPRTENSMRTFLPFLVQETEHVSPGWDTIGFSHQDSRILPSASLNLLGEIPANFMNLIVRTRRPAVDVLDAPKRFDLCKLPGAIPDGCHIDVRVRTGCEHHIGIEAFLLRDDVRHQPGKRHRRLLISSVILEGIEDFTHVTFCSRDPLVT